MRRGLAWLVLLALMLLLCGCGKEEAAEKQGKTGRRAVFGVDAKTGAWIGQGGCYTLAPADYPKNCQQSFLYKGSAAVSCTAHAENALLLGGREILRTEEMISWADAGEDGIWVALEGRNENGSVTETMIRLDETAGERERDGCCAFPAGCFPCALP